MVLKDDLALAISYGLCLLERYCLPCTDDVHLVYKVLVTDKQACVINHDSVAIVGEGFGFTR